MDSIAGARGEVIVGVDTHKDQHVAVAIDGLGSRLGEACVVEATNAGYADLLSWANSLGSVKVFAVEGRGSYGIGLARFLRRNGHPPVEVARPARKGERRLVGKSDEIDAEHAARAALSGTGVVTPKLANGQIEAIRLVKIARDTAVKARTTSIITLKAVLVTAGHELRDELEPLSDFDSSQRAQHSTPPEIWPTRGSRCATRSRYLANRWLDLHEEIKVHTHHLESLTRSAAPNMLDAFGIGADIAAQMLITAGDNNDRVRNDAAFAKLCGACPIPAGSGKTNGRHRLNRGGNRQANAALYGW